MVPSAAWASGDHAGGHAMVSAEEKRLFQQKLETIQNTTRTRIDDFKTSIAAKQAQLQAMVEARRQSVQNEITKIKNEQKRTIVEGIYTKINDFNRHRTDHLAEVITQLESVLQKIKQRTEKASAHKLDVASVRTAITEAERALDAAHQAVAMQAEKVYVITISAEKNMKTEIGTLQQTVHGDVKALYETVKRARASVQNAAMTLGQIPGVDDTEIE